MLLLVGCRNGDSFILNTVTREISRADISFDSNLYLTHSANFHNNLERWHFYGTKLGKKVLFSTQGSPHSKPTMMHNHGSSRGKHESSHSQKRHWITRKLPIGDLFVNFSIEGDYIVIAGLEKLIIV